MFVLLFITSYVSLYTGNILLELLLPWSPPVEEMANNCYILIFHNEAFILWSILRVWAWQWKSNIEENSGEQIKAAAKMERVAHCIITSIDETTAFERWCRFERKCQLRNQTKNRCVAQVFSFDHVIPLSGWPLGIPENPGTSRKPLKNGTQLGMERLSAVHSMGYQASTVIVCLELGFIV